MTPAQLSMPFLDGGDTFNSLLGFLRGETCYIQLLLFGEGNSYHKRLPSLVCVWRGEAPVSKKDAFFVGESFLEVGRPLSTNYLFIC